MFTREQPTEQCRRAFLSKYVQLREIMDMIDGDECPHIPLLYVPFSLHGWLLYPDISFPLCISRLSNKQRTKQGSMITVYQSSSSPPKRPPPLMSTSSSSSSSSFSSSPQQQGQPWQQQRGQQHQRLSVTTKHSHYPEQRAGRGCPFRPGEKRTPWSSREQWCFQRP